MNDLIIANMATCPERKHIVWNTIVSILKQVDILNISFNRFDFIPGLYDDYRKINRFLDMDNMAERGKFLMVDKVKGYYLTIDDDIIYPDDYCVKMIDAVERYNRKSIITVHGNKIKQPFTDFYKDRDCFRHKESLASDTVVDFPGTGTVAFHTDTLKFSVEDFEHPYMSDIWLGLIARQRKIPVIAIARQQNWLKPVYVPGIFEKVSRDIELKNKQTALIKEFINAA